MRKILSILFANILLCGAFILSSSTIAKANAPALDRDFADPAVLRANDGYYYAYATQSERDGKMVNIQVARSRDLVTWHWLADALPKKPKWASQTQDFWAPHVTEHDGRYFLYYSAKPDAALRDEGRGLCLAVATASRPEGPFTDMGKPLQCGEGFINIDPMAFDDPATGRSLLYWGSGFGPIKVQELASDRISFKPGSTPQSLIDVVKTEDPANYRRLVEGAWMVRRGGWYYLFYSGDNCCGAGAHYAVMVARSRSATGPFDVKPDRGGVILEADRHWIAPGHNSIITDRRGVTRILYHAIDASQPRTRPGDEMNSRRVLRIDRIVWRNGWPQIDRKDERKDGYSR